jgi:hypothetical protein
MAEHSSFYRDLGDGLFASTHSTAGPWSPQLQHAGPPSALLGRAFERHQPREGMRVARVTLEIPRPVPVADLEVRVRTLHSGRSAEILEGELVADGRPVMLARAWRLAAAPADTPSLSPAPAAPPLPGPQPFEPLKGAYADGYVSAMEWRNAEGGFNVPGPGTVWGRQRIPLVADEPDTPLTRALTIADSNWAVAFELDHVARLVINTDVTLALPRDPVGPWLCLRAATTAAPTGSGLASGELHDTTGECGRILQTLIVAER